MWVNLYKHMGLVIFHAKAKNPDDYSLRQKLDTTETGDYLNHYQGI